MDDSERRKAVELLREMRCESNAGDGNTNNQESRLNWMYKRPSDLVDREEYLLGKTIDKTFEMLNTGTNSDIIGRTGELSNVPKRLLEKTDSTEQVDIDKKILEDPLYAIKQKEMEARKKLLNNPVKLKQIKQMLLERMKQSSAHKKKKKKKLKEKSEEYLNLLILKKLKKFTDKEKRKALNKIMQDDSSSVESSSSHPKKEKKNKAKRKRDSSSSDKSDSSSESSDSSDESERAQKHKKKKKKYKKRVKNKKDKSSSDYDSSDNKSKEKLQKEKKTGQKKHSRKSVSSSDESERYEKSENKSADHKSVLERRDHRISKRKSPINERENRHKGSKKMDKKDDYPKKSSTKPYGLMMPDGSKPGTKRTSPVRRYEKKVESKAKNVPLPKLKPLSEKERKEKLKEMMINAQQRKEDRERNLASHRKKISEEEEVKTYDDDFMRRQMSHLTSQGTMADRIKSNINNIQRSKSSMNSSFMQK